MAMYSQAQRKRYAKKLRKHQTAAEKKLWPLYFLGFRPQKYSESNYLPDWLNQRSRIIVECDGGPHFTKEGKRKDKARDRHHKKKGYLTLRFRNETVLQKRGRVITYIFFRSLIHQCYLWFKV